MQEEKLAKFNVNSLFDTAEEKQQKTAGLFTDSSTVWNSLSHLLAYCTEH
jgi:hypothetical protein